MTVTSRKDEIATGIDGLPALSKRHWNEFPLGVLTDGTEVVWDASEFPHLLIAGTAGSGQNYHSVHHSISCHCA